MLTNIRKVLPLHELTDGHGHEWKQVLQLALTQESKHHPTGFPGAILVVFSLDAKFIFKKHYTQASLRYFLNFREKKNGRETEMKNVTKNT